MFTHAHDPTGELVDRLAHELSAAHPGPVPQRPEKRAGFHQVLLQGGDQDEHRFAISPAPGHRVQTRLRRMRPRHAALGGLEQPRGPVQPDPFRAAGVEFGWHQNIDRPRHVVIPPGGEQRRLSRETPERACVQGRGPDPLRLSGLRGAAAYTFEVSSCQWPAL